MTLRQTVKSARRELIRTVELGIVQFARRTPPIYPDFMCIGAPRAATTWLYDRLRADPQIYLTKVKELHFFDEARPARPGDTSGLHWHRSFYFDMSNPSHRRWYWRQFRNGRNRTKGDITPAYSMLSAARVRFIFNEIPDLKVIYIIRNPIDRAWSSLRKMVWFQKGAHHKILKDRDWLLRTAMHPELLARGDYRKIIETWQGVFPDRNLLYVFHDDIEENEQAIVGDIYRFLDLPMPRFVELPSTENRINAVPPMPMPDNVRSFLENHYENQIRYLEARFGRDLRHWITDPKSAVKNDSTPASDPHGQRNQLLA